MLQSIGWRRLPCYVGTGFVLGASLAALLAGLLVGRTEGLGFLAASMLVLGPTGATAAGTFRRVYAGDVA